jgi:hypothetical protein
MLKKMKQGIYEYMNWNDKIPGELETIFRVLGMEHSSERFKTEALFERGSDLYV